MNPTTDDEQVELERMRALPLGHPRDLPSHVFDLTTHEQRRLTAALAAMTDLDPGAVAAEAEAHRLLYGGLDADQQATYRMLLEAGVLDA